MLFLIFFLAIVVTLKTLFVFLYVVFTSVHTELTHGSYVVFVIVHTFNKFSVIFYVVFTFVDNPNKFYVVTFVAFVDVCIGCNHINMYH
jgi:ABC-type transport system involved in multi-copper enzyme maturation permease subunit